MLPFEQELPSAEFMLEHPAEFAQIWALQLENKLLREDLERSRELQDGLISAQIAYLDPDLKKSE